MLRSRPETSLGPPVIQLLRGDLFGFTEFAQERVIILAGQSVSLDLIAQGPEKYLACELKRYLSPEVIEQAIRWLDHANLVCIAVEEPHNQSKAHQIRRDQLARIGVGLFYVQDETASVVIPPVWRDSNTRLLEKALAAHDGSHDAVAGSAAAKRMTPARCEWEQLRIFLQDWKPLTWAEVRRACAEMRAFTSANVVRAIDRGECLGVRYTDEAPRKFYATTNGSKT